MYITISFGKLTNNHKIHVSESESESESSVYHIIIVIL